MNYALIFAGGSGTRMGTAGLPKQFINVNGKPVFIRTLEVFDKCLDIDGIYLVTNSNYIDLTKKYITEFGIKKVKRIVPGGESSYLSIDNGLRSMSQECCRDDIVLIHDGVRPIIDEELIIKNIQCAKTYGNAISSIKAYETIFIEEDNKVSKIFNRNSCRIARAPQTFILGDVIEVHNKAFRSGIKDSVDSATLFYQFGYKLYYVDCNPNNIKITTSIDVHVFKCILDSNRMK